MEDLIAGDRIDTHTTRAQSGEYQSTDLSSQLAFLKIKYSMAFERQFRTEGRLDISNQTGI